MKCLVLLLILSASSTVAQHKIFETNFGGTVRMGQARQMGTSSFTCITNNGWWEMSGGDVRGFTFPISLYGNTSHDQGLQPNASDTGRYIYFDSSTREIKLCSGSTYMTSTIEDGIRHDGSTGKIWHRTIADMYDQMSLIVAPPPGKHVPDLYQMLWVKLPANLAKAMGPNQWYEFGAWKTSKTSAVRNGENYDYRLGIFIYTDREGRPYWGLTGTEHSAGPNYFRIENRKAAIPLGKWFKFEWYWHRSDENSGPNAALTWVRVNDFEVLRQSGDPKSCLPPDCAERAGGFFNSPAPINRIFIGGMYGPENAVQHSTEQWIDHLEIWDGVPPSAQGLSSTTTRPSRK